MTLTRAAEALKRSQPALSNRLREIERLTDTQIFDRSAGRLNVTPLGQVSLNTARTVLDEPSRAETSIARAGGVAPIHPIGGLEEASRNWRKSPATFARLFPACIST